MLEQFLAGSAIGSVLIAFWAPIKSFLQRLRSLVFVNVCFDGGLDQGVTDYCWTKLKRIRLGGDYLYISLIRFLKNNRKNAMIPYEDFGPVGALFWYGFAPILVWRTDGQDGGPSQPSSPGKVMISYIRGTMNIDNFVLLCSSHYDKKSEKGMKHIRYQIIPRIGTFGNKNEGNNKNKNALYSKSINVTDWGKRIVGYSQNDLDDGSNDIEMKNILAYPEHILEALEDARKWSNSRDWYKKKAIPWKRGWLLYGPPGTGKTSLVKMVGEELDMPVHVFAISTFRNSEFQEAWMDMRYYTPVIALIEDIDTVFEGRKNVLPGLDEGRLTFDTFLNSIDGIQSTEGIFTIITTNRVELLDSSLGTPNSRGSSTRPGRIDLTLELGLMDRRCREIVANRILSEWPQFITEVVKEGEGDTAAQFQDRCSCIALSKFWGTEPKKMDIKMLTTEGFSKEYFKDFEKGEMGCQKKISV